MIFDSRMEKDGDLTELGVAYLCNQKGELDLGTVNAALGKFYSRNQMQVFADNYFKKRKWEVPEKSSITEEEFRALYEFGKHPRVSQWVLEVYETTGKLLTKKDLFEWILK